MWNRLLRLAGRSPSSMDDFPVEGNDPLFDCHLMIQAYLEPTGRGVLHWVPARDLWNSEAGQAIAQADPALQVRLALAAAERITLTSWRNGQDWLYLLALQDLINRLLRRKLPFGPADLTYLAEVTAGHLAQDNVSRWSNSLLLSQIERFAAEQPVPLALHTVLQRWLQACRNVRYQNLDLKKQARRLAHLLDEKAGQENVIEAGEAWTDAIRADLQGLPEDRQAAWQALFSHAIKARSSTPSAGWRGTAQARLAAVGEAQFYQRVLTWLSLINQDRRQQMSPLKAEVLKGLVWFCDLVEDEEIKHLLADVALACYHKIPQLGARAMKVGNACVQVLGGQDAVGELTQLRLKVKYRQAQALIERHLQAAAERAGISPAELEEISVPTYGLTSPGRLKLSLGEYTAELRIEGSGTVLVWHRPDGTIQRSIPATVSREHGQTVKGLKRTAGDIKKMIPAQRARLERLLTGRVRQWTLAQWQKRYLHHPLLAPLTRRLVWQFQLAERRCLGIWLEGQLVDVNDQPLDWLSEDAVVRPWHPLGYDIETVREWRAWLLFHEVTQPFKQAHRELYLLTDAEMETETYSNRFAAHQLRQHQLAALCRERGWRYTLQGGWDSHNIPTLTLPQWGLHAEFWVEMVYNDDRRNSLSDSGIALYVTTDQVRFFDQRREPLSLLEVPALAFSEVMRDVDLFVGVCSVGNDPNWNDRGERPGYDAYWHTYAFGDLSVSAETRKEVLEQLIPRLKIAPQCSFEGKFLVVQGKLRTYKIHLGSGNILMEPNNQYLCIVPDRRASATRQAGKVFLPFEGDTMSSLILSKAFLLTHDDAITDPTILRQIR